HLCDFPGWDYAKGHTKKSFRLHKSVKPPGNGLKADYTITHSRRRRAANDRDIFLWLYAIIYLLVLNVISIKSSARKVV
ncbi:MAG TPA: hypothetical protein VGJ93_12605, partial [Desulfuromonadaceae bacterium]